MFEEKLKEFELNETMYPYKCSLLVLDRIQQEVGDLVEAEDKLRGFKPRVDADGLIDRTTGTWTLPSVDLTCKAVEGRHDRHQRIRADRTDTQRTDASG